jgi:hypothetical protein
MTTPDSFGAGGATSTGPGGTGGLAAGPGDDQGERPVTQEAEQGRGARPPSAENATSVPGTEGGLAQAGDTGPDLTEDDEETAADR